MNDLPGRLLDDYLRRHPGESERVRRFRRLLEGPEALLRTGRPGHITASALVLDPERTKALLVRHRKLGIWLQPGGHVDGSRHWEQAARRELREETGLAECRGDGRILDLDIHAIPARKDEDAHDHYDVRFLFTADPGHPLRLSDESTDLRWVDADRIAEFTMEESILRMLRKARSLRPR